MKLAIAGSRGYPSTYGGFETLVRYLAPYLVAQGHEVTVYCREPGAMVARTSSTTIDGVECVTTPGIDRKTLSTLTFGLTALRHSARRRHDAVIVLNPANGLFLRTLERRRIPSIVNVDGLEWKRDKWNAMGKWVFLTAARQVAKRATTIVVDAKAIGDVWAEEFGVPSTYIPYGGDIIDVGTEAKIAELGLAPSSYVLYVGRLVPENNVDLFMAAARQLRERHPIVVVGSAGYGGEIEARMAELAEHPNVHWLGHVHDQVLLTELWANAGVYFHGHSVGGTNPSLVQALGAGAPVVAFDSVFNREVLADAGIIVPGRAADVAAALSELMDDPSARRRLRKLGQERVATAYTWEGVCRGYLDAVLQAVADMSPSRAFRTTTTNGVQEPAMPMAKGAQTR